MGTKPVTEGETVLLIPEFAKNARAAGTKVPYPGKHNFSSERVYWQPEEFVCPLYSTSARIWQSRTSQSDPSISFGQYYVYYVIHISTHFILNFGILDRSSNCLGYNCVTYSLVLGLVCCCVHYVSKIKCCC